MCKLSISFLTEYDKHYWGVGSASVAGRDHSCVCGDLHSLGFDLSRNSLRDRDVAAVFDGGDAILCCGRDPFYVGEAAWRSPWIADAVATRVCDRRVVVAVWQWWCDVG